MQASINGYVKKKRAYYYITYAFYDAHLVSFCALFLGGHGVGSSMLSFRMVQNTVVICSNIFSTTAGGNNALSAFYLPNCNLSQL